MLCMTESSVAAVKLDLVFHRRAVFILQRGFERHRHRIRRNERNKLARRRHKLLYGREYIVYAPLGRHEIYMLCKDLIYKI